MRQSRLLVCLVSIVAFAHTLFAQTPSSTTISVEYFNIGNACGGVYQGTLSAQFSDTAGSAWNELVVRLPLQRDASLQAIPTVSVAINNVPIGSPVQVSNSAICWDNLLNYEFRTTSIPRYVAFGNNTLSVTVQGGHAGGPAAQLTFVTHPAKFTFEYAEGQLGQKMLIHKYRSDDVYPSPYQIATLESEKPRFRFPGKVEANGVGVSRDVWLRVIDPPDTAAYVPAADRVPNDNLDNNPKGTLTIAGCSAPSCRAAAGAPLWWRSQASGVIDVVLEGTDRHAGDNYQIEASMDEQFTCATAGPNGSNICARSAIVTAWKRVYLEKKNMFRHGSYIIRNANLGDARVAVSDPTPFAAGQVVQLIHGPRLERVIDPNVPLPSVPVDFFSSETNVIVRVEPATATLPAYLVMQHPLAGRYRVDESFMGPGGTPVSYIQDAVGIINAGHFVANPAFISQPFDDSFVEYADLPRVIDAIPSEPNMGTHMLLFVASKWYENAVRGLGAQVSNQPNHRILIGSSRLPDDSNTGGARFGRTPSGGGNVSWAFVDRIEAAVHEPIQPVYTLSALRVNGEVAAHELVHQWNVNPVTAAGSTHGHCLESDYRPISPGFCLMHAPFNTPLHNPEFGDGDVYLHYRKLQGGGVDSEYMTIRGAVEPLPLW